MEVEEAANFTQGFIFSSQERKELTDATLVLENAELASELMLLGSVKTSCRDHETQAGGPGHTGGATRIGSGDLEVFRQMVYQELSLHAAAHKAILQHIKMTYIAHKRDFTSTSQDFKWSGEILTLLSNFRQPKYS